MPNNNCRKLFHSPKKCFILAIVFAIFLTPLVNKEYRAIIPPAIQNQQYALVSILTNFLGEIRSSIAALLFIKSEAYFHEMENQQNWKDQLENMPLFRLVTIIDPHMIPAYDTGSYHLAVNLKKIKEGLEFLEEGLANNPNSPELHLTAALIYFRTKTDDKAAPHAMQAEALTKDPILKKNARRIQSYALYRQGKLREALAGFQELLRLEPGDRAALQKIKELKELLTPTNLPLTP